MKPTTDEQGNASKQTTWNWVGKVKHKEKDSRKQIPQNNKQTELQQQIDQLKTESDQQKQQIRDLKRDKKQTKDENTRLKAKIHELEKQASALKA